MNPTDIIVIIVLALIIGAATAYIIKAKKSGKKCIGCPDSCSCSEKSKEKAVTEKSGCTSCSSCCGCNSEKKI